jgi:transposase-like protein
MPWKESSVMEERLRFVARLLEGEAMTDLCREFGISRKTGHKIFDRYKEHGLEALTDRSRRPVRYANQLPAQVDRQPQTRQAALGGTQAARASAQTACRRRPGAGQKHHPCRPRSPLSRQAYGQKTPAS